MYQRVEEAREDSCSPTRQRCRSQDQRRGQDRGVARHALLVTTRCMGCMVAALGRHHRALYTSGRSHAPALVHSRLGWSSVIFPTQQTANIMSLPQKPPDDLQRREEGKLDFGAMSNYKGRCRQLRKACAFRQQLTCIEFRRHRSVITDLESLSGGSVAANAS